MKINITNLHKKTDERGWLIENENNEIKNKMKHFFVSFSNPGIVRGQHYHTKKVEWFLVVKGEASITFKDVKSKEVKVINVSAEKPQMVEIPVMMAHAIKNTGDQEMCLMAIVNEVLNQENPDTFPCKVV